MTDSKIPRPSAPNRRGTAATDQPPEPRQPIYWAGSSVPIYPFSASLPPLPESAYPDDSVSLEPPVTPSVTGDDLATTDPHWLTEAIEACAAAVVAYPGPATVDVVVRAALPILRAGIEADLRKQLAAEIRTHGLELHSHGDGWHEPSEEWATCLCGADLGSWIQVAEDQDHKNYDPFSAFLEHLASISDRIVEGRSAVEALTREADAADRAAGIVRVHTEDPATAERVARAVEREGGAPGNSIHSWRCEYPERYGPCNCVFDLAVVVLAALQDSR